MSVADLPSARESLRLREGTLEKHPKHIADWKSGDADPPSMPGLAAWAVARGIEGVVWTALPAKFGKVERTPTSEEVIAHLRTLEGPARDLAEAYVRRTPRQVDTPIRRKIEAALGWTPTD
jgi:hypothetical protein